MEYFLLQKPVSFNWLVSKDRITLFGDIMMDAAQLLILYKEHHLTVKDMSVVLNIKQSEIRTILKGRIKPQKPKRSWLRKCPK